MDVHFFSKYWGGLCWGALLLPSSLAQPSLGNPFSPFSLLLLCCSFPAAAVATLQSGRLQSLMLESLRLDQELWESQGGTEGLRPLLRTIDRRARILLRYIQEHNLTVFGDSLR